MAKPATSRKMGAAEPPVPSNASLAALREASAGCRACDLWRNATQTVFGAGKPKARVMLVGEQPGDQEDLAGKPFVGPAGRMLDQALLEAGIDRSEVYLTNIVKHFRWVLANRGKRRIHKRPSASQINACRPWFDAEMACVQPHVLVCLGATAAQSLLGKAFSVTANHGRLVKSPLAPKVMATVHPSSILRAPDAAARRRARQSFVRDLRKVAALLK